MLMLMLFVPECRFNVGRGAGGRGGEGRSRAAREVHFYL